MLLLGFVVLIAGVAVWLIISSPPTPDKTSEPAEKNSAAAKPKTEDKAPPISAKSQGSHPAPEPAADPANGAPDSAAKDTAEDTAAGINVPAHEIGSEDKPPPTGKDITDSPSTQKKTGKTAEVLTQKNL